MNVERTLIAATLLLAVGLSLVVGYSHGSVSFSAAYPVSGASLLVSLNTTGLPAMAGFGATVLGALLLVVGLVQAIVSEVLAHPESRAPERTPIH